MSHFDPEFRQHQDDMHAGQVDKRKLPQASPEMNVTPLIDVLLVLLVIFMAALPLTQVGVDITLPLEVESRVTPPTDQKTVSVELDEHHKLTLNKQEVPLQGLDQRIKDLLANRKEKTVLIVGDGSLKYGEMIAIIDAAVAAGGRAVIVTQGMKDSITKHK